MAIITYKTALMIKEGSEYKKLIDIKNYPNLQGAPEMLETTTLSNKSQTFIPGIQSNEALEFTSNYTLDEYKKLLELKGELKEFSIWFGGVEETATTPFIPNGVDGKFNFSGYLTVIPLGAEVNAVREMTINIAPTTSIELVGE